MLISELVALVTPQVVLAVFGGLVGSFTVF